ncbi:Wzz/FepE/Etk N-terminal domain-containing protein [Blastococcus sp. SYSU D00813]
MLETAATGAPGTAARADGGRGDGVVSQESEPGLREYLRSLRRYWWLALLTFLVVVAASVASLYVVQPVYRAEAEVLLRTEESRQLFPRTSGTTPGALTRSPGSELVYVESDEFRDQAEEAAGDGAEVEVRGRPLDPSAPVSSALVFVAEADTAREAQEAAQTWAETYVALRHQSDVADTTQLRDLLVTDRDLLQLRQAEILAPVAALDDAVAAETDPVELSRLLNQRLAIQRSLAPVLDPVEDELRRVSNQIAGLEVDLRVMEDPEALAYVSSAAELPEERSNGSLRQSVLVGVVAGLVLAGGAVSAAQALRRR